MIDTVRFVLDDGTIIRPYENYGIFLVNYDAPSPEPKIVTVDVDGINGEIDMSDWAGEVKYNTRIVNIKLRDMHMNFTELVSMLNGSRASVYFSAEPGYHYSGRCSKASHSTRKRVTDIDIDFLCSPYKFKDIPTVVSQDVSSSISIPLRSAGMAVIPSIRLTQGCTLTWEGVSYTLSAGLHSVPGIVLTRTLKTLTVSGSGRITLEWTDGVI